jgi:hypothetical protein
VDSEGRDTKDVQADGVADSNVVRFPRDWIGPREELVPFGPRAYSGASETDAGAVAEVGAEDFWGEESGALHHAVRDPDWRGPGGSGGGVAAPAVGGFRFRNVRVSRAVIARAGIAIAAGLLALVVVGVGSGGRPHQAVVTGRDGSTALAAVLAGAGRHMSTVARDAQKLDAALIARARAARRVRRSSAPHAAAAPAHEASAAEPASSYVSTGGSHAAVSTPGPSGEGGGGSASGGGGHSGPVGAGAPFGPGKLG